MNHTYVVTGTLTDAKTVQLDEPLPVPPGKVRVTVQVVEAPTAPAPGDRPQWLRVLEGVWAHQNARGHVPMTVEEIEAQIREERESWDD